MKKLFCILICFLSIKASATHIVGGEMIYDDLGGGNYRITLKAYRDCFNGIPPFDGQGTNAVPAYITVYDGLQNLLGVYDIGSPTVTIVPPAINNPCILTPNTVCVEQGIYTYTLNLPPKTGGYYIVYQRCCRNGTILNIVTPGDVGSTYYTHIPGPEVVVTNSSPRFKNLPPIFVCNGLKFNFDHSATDPNGDVLVYSICPPFQGLDGCCAVINAGAPSGVSNSCPNPPTSCPTEAAPPPYASVLFSSPYTSSYPIASNPAFSINPTTGMLSGTPNMNGQWVFGICVQEFRGNQLINTHYRDFQINVVTCSVTILSAVQSQLSKCQGNTFNFVNQSVGGNTFSWNFGVPNLTSDTSSLFSPSYTYADTGSYVVTLIANPGKPCADTSTKTFYVYPPLTINFPPNDKQCLKGNSFSFTANGVYLPQTTFNWNFTSSATPSTSTLKDPTNIVFTDPGKFFVKLIAKQFTCIDSFIDSIRIIGRPNAKINNLPTSLCDPAHVAFSNGSSSDLPLSYLWNFSNGNSSTAYEPVQVFSPPGVYGVTLTVMTQSICIDTSMVSVNNVTVNPSPFAGFSFSPQVTSIFDPEITINNMASWDVLYWQYFFGDGNSSVFPYEKHTYQEYGNYLIEQIVTNNFGCTDTISQVVKILPEFRFWIPNAFTPDENLMNDYFMPIAIGVVNYEFEIFDRWGEKLFKTNNPKQGWNGYYKSQECKQDIYVWRITFKNVVTEKEEIHYGHVTLLKNR
ncbi:MAG: PKD domain-containing protein [Bacteroidota bacterium]|nr:PKD domain-containing protein [Bacteroidota bacterium]MDP3147164.1 PKD domain-containing protein [Bacteroidota bacterium]